MSLFNFSLMDKITGAWVNASLGVESALISVSPRGTRAAECINNEEQNNSSDININAANIIDAEPIFDQAPEEEVGAEKKEDSSYVTSVEPASQNHEKFIVLDDKNNNPQAVQGIFGIEVKKNPDSERQSVPLQNFGCIQNAPIQQSGQQIMQNPANNVQIPMNNGTEYFSDLDTAIDIAEQISANTGNPVLDILRNKEVMDAAARQLQEYQYNMRMANAVHRKDEPPKPIQKKAAKVETEVDDIKVSDISVAKPFVDPEKDKYKEKHEPDVISNKIETKDLITKPIAEPLFDNSAITSKYPYMKDIETMALKEDVQLSMQHVPSIVNIGHPSGLISCYAYTDGIPNVYKSFTIDTGVIIDRRVKMYPALVENGAILDTMQAYPVCIESKNGKNKSSVLNEELFYDLFTGGISNMPRNGMYRGYQELNKYVDIITLPTKDLNHDDRKKIMNRLVNSMKCGVFKRALEMSPNSRFRFIPATLNKKKLTFSLTNEDVPLYYNSIPQNNKIVTIDFGPDNKTDVKCYS